MADEQTQEQVQAAQAEAQADAEEVKQDLADAKEELADAKKDGNDERATQLERRIDALTGDLDEIKSTLKKLADRPFAPAPAAKEKVVEKGSETAEAEPEKPKERVHRFGSRRWFGDRAYED